MRPRLVETLGSLRITVAGLFLLLVLTVWGTIYQVDHGLYASQERFYQSWGFLVGGFLPFPGAQSVMAVLFVNLVAATIHRGFRGQRRLWMVLTHVGLMLMLAAGAVTFYFGRSAHLTLAEGEAANVAVAYSEWELAVLPAEADAKQKVFALDAEALKRGRVVPLPAGSLAIRVEEFHRNSEAGREAVASPPLNDSGLTVLRRLPRCREPAEDMPGLVFTLLEDGRDAARCLLWGDEPLPTLLRASSGVALRISLRRQRLPLPAEIRLLDFRRELHPGSGIARSYESLVSVRSAGDLERKVLISMNKPLRLHGYTFYQSSFSVSPGGAETSTLAVVLNRGRMIPYVATGATGAGMLLHFTAMLASRLRRRSSAEATA